MLILAFSPQQLASSFPRLHLRIILLAFLLIQMVADMAISSVKLQPPRTRAPADPNHQYGFLFKADNSPCSFAKPHNMGGTIYSPDDCSNSWETRAFVIKDARNFDAGIWPPRSYPCSFCRREFRSAQALGGHMNVHRRDRARLRRSSPPPAPFSVPLTTPQPISSSFPDDQRYSINSPAQHPSKSLVMLNTAPIPLSMSKILPSTVTPYYTSSIPSCPSDVATSFPLRLQQLASEAVCSLMYPHACESSDLILSLRPTSSTRSANFACNSNNISSKQIKEVALEISSSSSFSSPPSSIVSCAGPSVIEAAPCRIRRDAPRMQPEDESPKKKFHTDSEYSHRSSEVIKYYTKFSHDDQMHAAHDTQSCPIKKGVDDKQRRAGECRDVVDLELRLSLRPP